MRAAIAAYSAKEKSCGKKKERVPRNFVKGILEGYGIDRDKFYYELKKTRADHNNDRVSTSLENNINGDSNHNEDGDNTFTCQKRGRRPQGSSKKEKDQHQENKENAISWGAQRLTVMAFHTTKAL
jgi:hypothetical protein